ncbi:YciI family protein [Mycolicibacterium sp. XJ1904]
MTEPSGAVSLFLFRLIPPRPDFAQTMTRAEQQAMSAHQEYWGRLLAEGRVVVYGPVADPEGVWGMGVLRAADRAEVLAIAERDPSITAGVNTFDVLEIMGGTTG